MSKIKDTFRLSLIAPSVCVTGMGPALNGHQGLQSAKSEETYLPHALRALLSSSDNGGLSLFLGCYLYCSKSDLQTSSTAVSFSSRPHPSHALLKSTF